MPASSSALPAASLPASSADDLLAAALRDLARPSPATLRRWLDQVHTLRGCAQPIRLTGERLTLDASTGEFLAHYTTAVEPHGQLMIRCKNRRASRCPSCAEEYRADTYHLIKAGLSGSKGVPATITGHPRVLATLTAPSFGPVHTGPGPDGRLRVCHPRRSGLACWDQHPADDPRIGQPLDPDSYDYTGHVVWNAHAGDLWRRFTIYLRRHLARQVGLTQTDFHRQVRVSFAKVAEYQARGLVHFHAVIRLDGPEPFTPPPAFATLQALDAAIRTAAATVTLPLDVPGLGGRRLLKLGAQVDVRPITAFDTGEDITDQAVAGYVAKYATKAAETTGTLDHRLTAAEVAQLHTLGLPAHAAKLIRTCWQLGDPIAYPELAGKRLRKWAHMLGFGGHFATKSRAYSTTYSALRQARTDHAARTRAAADDPEGDPPQPLTPDPDTVLVINHWSYAGQGYTPAENALACALANRPPGWRKDRSHAG